MMVCWVSALNLPPMAAMTAASWSAESPGAPPEHRVPQGVGHAGESFRGLDEPTM